MSLLRISSNSVCYEFKQLSTNFWRQWVAIITFIALSFFSLDSRSDILHLELGAANYDVFTAHRKDAPIRFEVLRKTLQDLTEKYGSQGTIYLNDIVPEGLNLAMEFAKSWAAEKGYVGIKFIAILGDYMKVDLPKVKSLHLTNPTWMQLPNRSEPGRRKELAAALEEVASLSETGLKITTYFLSEMNYLNENISSNSALTNTKENGYRYYFSDGLDPGYENPKIFVLSANKVSCGSLFKIAK